MRQKTMNKAFTLIELLVVVAIIALLISILLPSLAGAKEQGKKTACLANMKSIAQACHAYASEDPDELVIPIHEMMVTQTGQTWLWRCANWFTWGGRSAPEKFFVTNAGGGPWLNEDSPTPADKRYAAARRPLNRYVLNSLQQSDSKKMEWFHCPSDMGYPDSPFIDDAPRANANRPMYDTVGNSYRGSLFCIINDTGAFAIGPWGHRLSTLVDAGRIIVMGEPTFFNMIGQDNGNASPDPVVAIGWHKRLMMDNLIFADGSARPTQATGHEPVDAATAAQMGIPGNAGLISRGPTWRFDLYPTPGARIWGSAAMWNPPYDRLGTPTQWPFAGAQRNLDN